MKFTKSLLLNTVFVAATMLVPVAEARTAPAPVTPTTQQHVVKVGYASYYSNHYNGRKTASGKRFSNASYMAAMNDLPLGARVRVTNLDNHRSVVVQVLDRGPFAKGRSIDLSRRAARDIGMLRRGVARVQIERLS